MSAWIVYSKDGSVERCELKALEYGGTAMGERAVTATFHHHSEVDFEVFDYIEYRGDKFELEAVPTVKKVSSFEYIYELRFVSLKYELERCEMRDLVPYDNEVVYPTPLTFSFTGNVRYLTERIQACLDALYGSGAWNIIIADGVESEEKNITIAQQNCWNALALVSSTYGLSFYIKGRTITVGGEQPLVGHTFEYGKGNGLYEIERASDTNTGIVTKLRAYGSTRNLDYSYPKRPEWSDSALPVTFAFSPLRLMLPSFKYDGKTDYVLADSATIAKYGIREASMVYDDIYPSITGATYNGQAIDEIKGVEEVDDNSDSFVVYLHDLGFDLEEHLTTADAQISMKTGAMQGYTFTIVKIEKQYENTATADITGEENPDEDAPEGEEPEENLGEFVGYKITLNRISAEGGENYNIPNSDWSMKAGDKFVLLNILMPQMYIREAENRLKERAEEYLAQYGKTNFSYNIGLHDKFLIENPSVYASLIEGSKLRVRDSEIGIDEEVTIQSITITENAEDNILPQVKVTLNNEPSASTLERIQGRIDALANESAAGNFATQSEIMAQYRKKLDKPYFDKLFVAVDANGKDIPSNDMTTPVAYIKAKYHFGVVGGITSFVNDVDLDLPSIYDGLPIDNQTLYWEEIKEEVGTDEEGNPIFKTTKVLKARGGNGGNSGGGTVSSLTVGESGGGNAYTSYTFVDGVLTLVKGNEFALESTVKTLQGDFTAMLLVLGQKLDENTFETWKSANEQLISNGNTAWGWGDHSKAGYVDEKTLVTALSKYVDLDTPQNISGEKNFTGGLLVKGKEIEYIYTDKDNSKGYWKLEGDLIVSGGITSFASSSGYTPSTIMDAIVCDNQTITIEDVDGVKMLKVIGGSGGSTTVDLTIKYDGSGNAITALSYKDGVFTATRGRTFAAKTGLDAINTRVTALEETIASGGGTGTGDLSAYATIDWVSRNFASLDGDNIFTKANEFNGGLFVNGKEIKYNSDGYWELEGDLLVTGGITSFANSSGFKPSTIMDGIVCDEQTITVDVINGVKTLKVIGGGSGTIHWDDIEDAPTSLKNPYALVINGTTYDGSKKVEINISGGSNNTQSIYPLIIKDSSGAKQLTYDPSSKQETLALTKSMVGLGNVENTALSSWEGSNKITTVGTISRGTWQGTPISNNKLANSSIEIAETSVSLGGSITSETLKTKLDIVTLSDGQIITGKKDFTNGLLVNGQELFFDKDERYWKMEGNLLVTGGITSYSSDGKATPFLINVDTWEDILSDSTTQVYSANAVTLLKTGVQSVREDADSALAKLAIIAEELSSLTTSSYTADIRTSLMNIATKIK